MLTFPGARLYETGRYSATRYWRDRSDPACSATRRRRGWPKILSSCFIGLSAEVSLLDDDMLKQRDHAIWFIDTKIVDGLELRQWMGNVDETIVAKHSARMGLVCRSGKWILTRFVAVQYQPYSGHRHTLGTRVTGRRTQWALLHGWCRLGRA